MVRTRLIGRYQVSNAALALSVLDRVWERFPRLTLESVYRGMEAAFWPGRLELLHRDPSTEQIKELLISNKKQITFDQFIREELQAQADIKDLRSADNR